MFDLSGYLIQKRKSIDASLKGRLRSALPENSRLKKAMTYSLIAGGKRLRPILCIAAAESVGGRPDEVMAGACAIEMIHTYSLIHDDLPAMDDDALRRGKPSCHIAFDEATAILAGDALLTLAFEVLVMDRFLPPHNLERALEVVGILSRAAGPAGMIQGQMEDIAAEGSALTLIQLRRLHSLKTGALIQASVEIGATLCGGSSRQLEGLKSYARELGLAFQVIDDVLNVEGDPSVMGKASGTDQVRKKSTYPALMGLEESKIFAKKCIESALQSLSDFDNKADPLRAIASYVIERKR